MLPIPTQIADFIEQHHVVSLACSAEGELWCASCFYWFDREQARLIILTDSQSRHGQLMCKNPQIAGTIAAQPKEIQAIEGVQFRARGERLSGEAQAVAFRQYFAKFPIAEKMQSEVWEVVFQEIKHTSNREKFGEKRYWLAQGGELG